MDGAARALGCACPITLQNTTYLLEPLTIGRLGILEAHILAQREYPTDCLLQMHNASKVMVQALYERALADLRRDKLSRIVTVHDLNAYLFSDEGVVMAAWLCLRPNHPDVFATYQQTHAILLDASEQERFYMLRVRQMVSGLDLLARLDWENESPQQPLKKSDIYRPTSWRKLIRDFAEGLFYSLDDIKQLTLYQLNIYTSDKKALGGLQKLSPAEAMQKVGSKKQFVFIGKGGKGVREWERAQQYMKSQRSNPGQ